MPLIDGDIGFPDEGGSGGGSYNGGSSNNTSDTDLTGTTWIFNDVLTGLDDSEFEYLINFTSNEENYTELYYDIITSPPAPSPHANLTYGTRNPVYNALNDTWLVDSVYKTIHITGGSDVRNANLVSWLEANATQQIDPQKEPFILNINKVLIKKNGNLVPVFAMMKEETVVS